VRKSDRVVAPGVLAVARARKRNWAALLLSAALITQPLHAQTTVAGFTPGSFRATETGAASYTIPIRVPPGIAGMEPKLALTSNSQGGNGLLGVGWGLQGLSVVHRCGRTVVQDGANAGVSYDANDKLCLDGQRLVLISGTYGADGTEYRTERESFTKIVSYGSAGTGPAWFKVWSKSGQVLEYGNTADSRIEAQGKSSVRIWALNKASDTKGNYFTVSYNEDNSNGEYSPSRIDYTGNGSNSPTASVRFTYASRTDNQPIYVGLSLIKLMNRMTNLKTYVGDTVVTDYRLAYDYSPNSGPSRLLSVTECTGDGTQCLSPTTFSWQNPSGGGFPSSSWSGQAGQLADVNGDGMADIVYAWSNNVYVRYSNGSGFGSAVYVGAIPVVGTGWDEAQGTYNIYAGYMIGDVDGNGRADVVFSNGTALLSTASGFSSVSWSGYSSGQLADVNGDGMADVVYASDSGLYARYSTGSEFSSPAQIGTLPVWYYGWSEQAGSYPIYPSIAVGDVDGNGRADTVLSTGPAILSTAQVPNLVTSITSSLGLASTITYKPLTDSSVYTADSDAAWPVRDLKQQGPLHAVSSVSVPNLAGGNAVTNYFYRGAKAHLKGGGFLGFRQVEATDGSTSIKTVTTSRQDYPYQGLPTQGVRKQSSGTVIAQSDSTYTDTVLTPASGSGGMYHKVELTQAVERSYELSGSLIVKATTATSYDSYGNATSITVSTAVNESSSDGYSKLTTNTYASPDTTNWFLGRLTRSTVQSTIP
jgi:hypothetical protein